LQRFCEVCGRMSGTTWANSPVATLRAVPIIRLRPGGGLNVIQLDFGPEE
jgi:hypothetical protein